MLAPEVWKIGHDEIRKSKQQYKLKECTATEVESLLQTNPLIHSVVLVATGCKELPLELSSIFKIDYEYYLVHSVPVTEFFDISFSELFAKKGRVSALSFDTDTHSEDTFAVLPEGLLILKLQESTYQKLGIEGNCFKHWNGDQYVIQLNLNDKSIMNGKLYERYKKNFESVGLRFDMVISWEPEDVSICPSSLASYLSKKLYKVLLCKCDHKCSYQTEEKLCSPFVDDHEEFLLWYSTRLLKTTSNFQDESKAMNTNPNVVTHRWDGFMMVEHVMSIWNCVRNYLENNPQHSHWFSIYVSGFQNSPYPSVVPNKNIKVNDNYYSIFCNPSKCAMYPFLYGIKKKKT